MCINSWTSGGKCNKLVHTRGYNIFLALSENKIAESNVKSHFVIDVILKIGWEMHSERKFQSDAGVFKYII